MPGASTAASLCRRPRWPASGGSAVRAGTLGPTGTGPTGPGHRRTPTGRLGGGEQRSHPDPDHAQRTDTGSGQELGGCGQAGQPALEPVGVGLRAAGIAGSVVIEAEDGQAQLGQPVGQGAEREIDADGLDPQGLAEDHPAPRLPSDGRWSQPNSGRSLGPNQNGVALGGPSVRCSVTALLTRVHDDRRNTGRGVTPMVRAAPLPWSTNPAPPNPLGSPTRWSLPGTSAGWPITAIRPTAHRFSAVMVAGNGKRRRNGLCRSGTGLEEPVTVGGRRSLRPRDPRCSGRGPAGEGRLGRGAPTVPHRLADRCRIARIAVPGQIPRYSRACPRSVDTTLQPLSAASSDTRPVVSNQLGRRCTRAP